MASRNNKIQLMVDDETANILALLPKFDKARFIEQCIKEGYKSNNLRELFSWNKQAKKVVEKKSNNKETVEIDSEESQVMKPKIARQW